MNWMLLLLWSAPAKRVVALAHTVCLVHLMCIFSLLNSGSDNEVCEQVSKLKVHRWFGNDDDWKTLNCDNCQTLLTSWHLSKDFNDGQLAPQCRWCSQLSNRCSGCKVGTSQQHWLPTADCSRTSRRITDCSAKRVPSAVCTLRLKLVELVACVAVVVEVVFWRSAVQMEFRSNFFFCWLIVAVLIQFEKTIADTAGCSSDEVTVESDAFSL